jgi:nucleoside-diphosphate-sugar epimerase
VRALVTGGNGYFGRVLVQRLVERGDTVRVLDIDISDAGRPGIEVIEGDIRDRNRVLEAAHGVDVVFHNVAQVPLAKDPQLVRSVNVEGTAMLLAAAADAGVAKVVHTSSSAIFGVPEANPVMPTTVPNPQEPYGHAKLAAEWACLRAAADGLDVSIVRPRTVLGHGRLGIFGILFDWIADGADPIVLGDGSNRYQFIHADDLAEVCMRVADRSGPAVFNAGTDRFGTMRDALDHLCAHAGTGARVRRLPARPPRCGRARQCDSRPSRRITG